MRKIAISLLFILIAVGILSAQVDFSGKAEIGFNANFPESDDYNSLINPDNIFGLKDAAISSSLIAKLNARDDNYISTFSAWFRLKEYPVGQALLAADYDAAESPEENAIDQLLTGEVITYAGDTIYSFDLMRFSANVYLGDYISMEVGRQSMLTGYGYGWNPIDFANPLKDPSDPDAALRGVDALSFKADLGSLASLKLYGVMPDDMLVSGTDFEEIKGGGELTLFFTGMEIKLAGFYDYDHTAGSDIYTPSLGAGFFLDLGGVGLYSEASIRKGSRNLFPDDTGAMARKDEWLFSILAGLEYTFSNELYVTAEYFYNGEGYDKTERDLFFSELETAASIGAVSSQLLSPYTPGYYARHYIMINLMQPLYDINTDLSFSAIFSPDAGSLMILPTVAYNFTGNFSGRLDYAGMFDLYDDDFSEVKAMPVHHSLQAVFTYSF